VIQTPEGGIKKMGTDVMRNAARHDEPHEC
jgi:hypothetical protein